MKHFTLSLRTNKLTRGDILFLAGLMWLVVLRGEPERSRSDYIDFLECRARLYQRKRWSDRPGGSGVSPEVFCLLV